ncbi:MAG: MarC family protein, partial [Acidiferrobacterales bacterium]
VLVAFALGGEYLLSALGIGLPAFRIAGGILLLLLAVDMVFARHTGLSGMTANEDEEARQREDVSIFPLAVPLIAGPGAMASAVLVMGQAQSSLSGQMVVLAMLALVLGLTLLSLLAAGYIMRFFGVTGVSVITRVAGIVLAALAAQYLLDGLRESELLRPLGD